MPNASNKPKASVIIPAYNSCRYILTALESVLRQEFDDFEVIVVDDGSTDGTRALVQKLRAHDPRIRYIYQENRGLSVARNTGIKHSRGEYLCFLDADDLLEQMKLQWQVDYLERKPAVDVVCSQWYMCDQNGRIVDVYRYHHSERALEELLLGHTFPVHTALVRREVVEEVGLFDEELGALEDWDFWLRIARSGGCFRVLDTPLVKYRVHDGTMSSDVSRMARNSFLVLDKFFSNFNNVREFSSLQQEAYARMHTWYAWRYFEIDEFGAGSHHLQQAIEAGISGRFLSDSVIDFAVRLTRRSETSGFGARFLRRVVQILSDVSVRDRPQPSQLFSKYYFLLAFERLGKREFRNATLFAWHSISSNPQRFMSLAFSKLARFTARLWK